MTRGCFSASPAISQERSRPTPTSLLPVRSREKISKLSARRPLNSAHLSLSQLPPHFFFFILKSAPLFSSLILFSPPSLCCSSYTHLSLHLLTLTELSARMLSQLSAIFESENVQQRQRNGCGLSGPQRCPWQRDLTATLFLSSSLSSQPASALLGRKLFMSLIITPVSPEFLFPACICACGRPLPCQVSPPTSPLAPPTAPWLTACQSFCIVRPRERRGQPSPGRKVGGLKASGFCGGAAHYATFGFFKVDENNENTVLLLLFSWYHNVFFPLPFFYPVPSITPTLLPAGERVLASGSVQLPRFTLLESGSLLISPSHLSDAGTYTCMASNSRGIDEASSDLVVWGKRIRNGA